MDIHDITKHPFKIECPAELFLECPDEWLFSFNNGYSVLVQERGDGTWAVTALAPDGRFHIVERPMTDEESEITNLLDRIARLDRS